MQSVMRFRNLRPIGKQNVSFVILEKERDIICGQLFRDFDAETGRMICVNGGFSLLDLLRHALLRQSRKDTEDTLRAFVSKVDADLMKQAFDVLFDPECEESVRRDMFKKV